MRGAHANIAFELTLSVKQTTARVRTLRRFYLTSATVGDVARRVVLGRAGGGGDLGWRGCVSKRVARNGSVACVAPTRLPTRPNATSRLVVPEPEFAAPPDLPDGRPPARRNWAGPTVPFGRVSPEVLFKRGGRHAARGANLRGAPARPPCEIYMACGRAARAHSVACPSGKNRGAPDWLGLARHAMP